MKFRWFVTLFGAIPFIAAALLLQSCGGEGGPTHVTGGLPDPSAAFLALLPDAQKTASYIGSEACATAACHGGATDAGETPIYEHWKGTKHYEEGVGCERCHGPGSVHRDHPDQDNILKFPQTATPVVCGQCHGPIHEQFNISQHSKLIVAPVEEALTDPARYGRTSRCIACHSGLVRAKIEDGLDLGTLSNEAIQQLCEETMTNVPHVANCVTCHDPHKKTGNLTADGEDKQLRRKTFNTDTTAIAPGSTAASFTNFDHICAQCHNGRGTNPADSALTTGTSRPSMHDSNQYNMLMGLGGVEGNGPVERNTAHATAPGQCSKCHTPDARHTFTVSYDKSCSPCHTAADAAARIQNEKDTIIAGLLAVRTRMESWATTTFSNDLFWEYTSTITAEGFTPPSQASVPIEIKRSRHNYYFVIRSGDYGAHNAPYAKHLIAIANQNLDSLGVPKAPVSKLNTQAKLQTLLGDLKRTREAEAREGIE